ncbi:cytochrome c biogenesis protein ResB [Nocardioides salsibiostraticola]
MTTTTNSPGRLNPGSEPPPQRRPGELNARELARWGWRQLTSMRTALLLLLLLALAAIPGSVVPQEGVDALAASRWRDEHPTLTPIYETLGLFSVYNSPWFSAIYILLMISLIGCIIPRTMVYARALRAQPPRAPRHLTRLADHQTYETDEHHDAVLDRARTSLKSRGYRVRAADEGDDYVSAERGYLREAGNLIFHLSVIVVLVGFAMGSLFGYKGGVIVTQGGGFANDPGQYDDFVPGSLFRSESMEPFSFTVDSFDVEWLRDGPAVGTARKFNAGLTYQEFPGAEEKTYDLRVNHPLAIGSTEVFLVGHGYAPQITVRDGEGNVSWSGPTVFLPQDPSFLSFGVVKAQDSQPRGIGLEGFFYPTFALIDGDPMTLVGEDLNPRLSMLVYSGDLSMNAGGSQSVYVLDKANADEVIDPETGKQMRIGLAVGQTVELPDGLGSVTFDGVEPWTRVQLSQSPGKRIALVGVVLALLGLLGSLFIRPRRVWVRTRREGGVTLVEIAALDRTNGGDVADVLDDVVGDLRAAETPGEQSDTTDQSNQPKGTA